MTNLGLIEHLKNAPDSEIVAHLDELCALSEGALAPEARHELADVCARVAPIDPRAIAPVIHDLQMSNLVDNEMFGYYSTEAQLNRKRVAVERVVALGPAVMRGLLDGLRDKPLPWKERIIDALLAMGDQARDNAIAAGVFDELVDALNELRAKLAHRPRNDHDQDPIVADKITGVLTQGFTTT